MSLVWPRPLPGFVRDRLVRGIPATLGYQVELWRDRSSWFDAHLATWVEEYHVLRDPWAGHYSLLGPAGTVTSDSLEALEHRLSTRTLLVPVQPEWTDSSSVYRVVVTTVVRPLTAKDVGEVEAWLRGELGGQRGGLLGIPRGLFGVIRDLSGLGDRKSKGESEPFHLWVRAPGEVEVTAVREQ